MTRTCAILLAAGYGRRFAEQSETLSNKLLAPCIGLDGTRRPVLEHALRAFEGWSGTGVLVVRRDSERRDELSALASQYGFDLLDVASSGMGDSLSAAVGAYPTAQGWLVALGDMPWVQAHTVQSVYTGMTPEGICLPVYQGQRGHPVGFGATYGQALSALNGDQGGRRLLEQGRVTLLEVNDPGIVRDVDVPKDLA